MKFIDTNVFVYFADGRDPAKQSVARSVLADAIGNPQCVISSQVLNLNKAVGIARRVRGGQFQLPYVLSAA